MKAPAATAIEPGPAKPGVGMKVAVYTAPVPLRAESVPPDTVMSSRPKVVTGSVTVKVIVAVEPTVSGPSPEQVIVIAGGTASTGIVRVVKAFGLPLPLVKAPATTLTVAEPWNAGAGVKVAVYTVPDPLKPDSEPPVTVMSAAVNSVVARLSVKVSLSLAPPISVPEPARAIATVGAPASTVRLTLYWPRLPYRE